MDPQTLRIGEIEFEIEFDGPADGTPVLLLHGFPETAACWRPVAELLVGHGIRTIAPNQRGYSPGARPLVVAEYAMELLVADVIGLLDALGLAQVDLVGHDWGAAVAWAVASMRPDRIRSLTTLSTPHPAAFGRARSRDGEQRSKSSYIDLFREAGTAERLLLDDGARQLRAVFGDEVAAELVEEHIATLTEPGALTAALNWYRAMGRWAGDDAPIAVPTTYIWGAHDVAIGRMAAEGCGEFIAAPYRFIEVPDAGHWLPETQAGVVASAILKSLG
ncbi:alpha/beta fold hydrolase [Tomitella biformata]|uniref:alpha/beta fold hydrolase n=1 Tax=Tomitella biformata TaxID=630403 RepID=UPI0004678239|nr:alpha/beta hydrolase [Tomitella biformata]